MEKVRNSKNYKTGEKKWNTSDAWEKNEAAIRNMAHELNILPKTAVLLYNRGLRDAESASRFLKKETELFYDPFLLTDMDKAVPCILDAVSAHKKIVIYGDYDVDGVTSVASLYLYLKSIGADVRYYIPNRAGEGYGINHAALDKFASDGVKLMITVDTGITASEEIAYAVSVGLEVIVTDHHECHNGVPEAASAVVNPRRDGCPYPFKELAGVGVVFIILVTRGFSTALWSTIILLALQQLDANVINPKILGDSLDLSPFWVIFAVTVGGGLFGFGGMLLSVPMLAVLRMLYRELLAMRKNRSGKAVAADDPPDGLEPMVPAAQTAGAAESAKTQTAEVKAAQTGTAQAKKPAAQPKNGKKKR